jgi:hypothetical protein
MPPDYAHARRVLREARVQEAIGELFNAETVAANRDRLLHVLTQKSLATDTTFGHLSDDQVETVVSIAVSAVEENSDDAVTVNLLCLLVLATDGQFARLAQIAGRLDVFQRQHAVERPFWALALRALSMALRGRETQALRLLNERLGVSGAISPENRREQTAQQTSDVIAAATLRASIDPDAPVEFVAQAHEFALVNGDGLLLAYVDAVNAWAASVALARPKKVLGEADPTFIENNDLARYVEELGVPTLFPAQIAALGIGATLDETRMVALPTSSGKTLIAELRIAAALTRNPGTRAIYVAPYRLL